MPPAQSALDPAVAHAIEVLTGSGVQAAAAQQADSLAGRELQRSGLSGYVTNPAGGYMNTLARDQFDELLGQADRSYALDVARFGLAQADLNYRQRATDAQNRMQELALQVSQRGPANAIGYNYLLNNRAAPTGTEKPITGSVSQPANITIPTAAPRTSAPPPAVASKPPTSATAPVTAPGVSTPFTPSTSGGTPNLTAENAPAWQASLNQPAPFAASTSGGVPDLTPSNAAAWQASLNTPKLAKGGVVDGRRIEMPRHAEGGTDLTYDERMRNPQKNPRNPDEPIPPLPLKGMSYANDPQEIERWQHGVDMAEAGQPMYEPPSWGNEATARNWNRYRAGYERGARGYDLPPVDPNANGSGDDYSPPRYAKGGFLDSLSAGQAATAMVGDSPSGAPTGAEEMATATMTPDGQPRLIVAPMDGAQPDPQSPEFQRGYQDAQQGTLDQQAMSNPDYQAGVAAFQQEQQQGQSDQPDQSGQVPQGAPGQGPPPQGGGFLDSLSQSGPALAAGGVVDPPSYTGGAGMSGGTVNTAYAPQDIANTPVVRQATGQEQTPRFGAYGGDTSIPGTDTKLPSGGELQYSTYADMLPSSRALLESIVSTPRDQGGLGMDWQDYLESSRRAAPIGRRLTPAAYG